MAQFAAFSDISDIFEKKRRLWMPFSGREAI
jgi:hypothetical protein